MFAEQLLRNGCLFIRLLHSNGCTRYLFRGLCIATGLYATTFTVPIPSSRSKHVIKNETLWLYVVGCEMKWCLKIKYCGIFAQSKNYGAREKDVASERL
jgi:hypothetical protein